MTITIKIKFENHQHEIVAVDRNGLLAYRGGVRGQRCSFCANESVGMIFADEQVLAKVSVCWYEGDWYIVEWAGKVLPTMEKKKEKFAPFLALLSTEDEDPPVTPTDLDGDESPDLRLGGVGPDSDVDPLGGTTVRRDNDDEVEDLSQTDIPAQPPPPPPPSATRNQRKPMPVEDTGEAPTEQKKKGNIPSEILSRRHWWEGWDRESKVIALAMILLVLILLLVAAAKWCGGEDGGWVNTPPRAVPHKDASVVAKAQECLTCPVCPTPAEIQKKVDEAVRGAVAAAKKDCFMDNYSVSAELSNCALVRKDIATLKGVLKKKGLDETDRAIVQELLDEREPVLKDETVCPKKKAAPKKAQQKKKEAKKAEDAPPKKKAPESETPYTDKLFGTTPDIPPLPADTDESPQSPKKKEKKKDVEPDRATVQAAAQQEASDAADTCRSGTLTNAVARKCCREAAMVAHSVNGDLTTAGIEFRDNCVAALNRPATDTEH